MNRDSILGLAPRKLARILGLTMSSDNKDDDLAHADIAELLSKCLHAKLPVAVRRELSWADLLNNLAPNQENNNVIVLIDVLTSPRSSLDTIKAIRKCAKSGAARNNTDPEHSVAITLYFAAIAHALLFQKVKITTYSDEALRVSFDQLISKPWLPKELRKLFVEAGRACRAPE